MCRAERHDVSLDDATGEALDAIRCEDNLRIPKHAEGTALKKLEGSLHNGGREGEGYGKEEEDTPAGGVFEAEEEECDR